eukprot:2056159-Rhodomonas_salina.1
MCIGPRQVVPAPPAALLRADKTMSEWGRQVHFLAAAGAGLGLVEVRSCTALPHLARCDQDH